jgi:hypothetical protein
MGTFARTLLARRVSRTATVVGALATVTLAFAPLAHAEGNFTSSITGAATGFNSRWWTDKNSDSDDTIIKFIDCTTDSGADFKSVTVQLTRYRPVVSDVNEGQKTFTACASGGTSSGNWGDKQSADYRFALMKINGDGSGHWMSVDTVKVYY